MISYTDYYYSEVLGESTTASYLHKHKLLLAEYCIQETCETMPNKFTFSWRKMCRANISKLSNIKGFDFHDMNISWTPKFNPIMVSTEMLSNFSTEILVTYYDQLMLTHLQNHIQYIVNTST